MEIILINDGSSDNSLMICTDYLTKDKRIILINSINLGVSIARNIGLEKASGDFIGFVDSDDVISLEMYNKLLEVIISENADIAECGYNKVYGKKIIKGDINVPSRVLVGTQNILNIYLSQNTITNFNCNKLFKKKCVEETRYKNIKYSEDFLFNISSMAKCQKYVSISEPLYFYTQHSLSTTSSKFNLQKNDQLIAAVDAKIILDKVSPNIAYKINYYILDRIILIANSLLKEDNMLYSDYYKSINRKFKQTYKTMIMNYISDFKFGKLILHFFYAINLKLGYVFNQYYHSIRTYLKNSYLFFRRLYD